MLTADPAESAPETGRASSSSPGSKKLVRRYVFELLSTLADENDPTGWAEDKRLGLGDGSHPNNQLLVDFADVLDDNRTYVQKLGKPDHTMFYNIDLKKQAPAPPA